MAERTPGVLIGDLLDETVTLTLAEFSVACRVREQRIIELVEEGILEPDVAPPRIWYFRATQLRRAYRAIRLQRDLDINVAGVALILDLLDEIEELRARLDIPRL